jgi:hypothetical protein
MAMRWTLAICASAFLLLAPAALACPNCKDAVANGEAGDDDPLREARAYNNSIYLMLAVPYTILGTAGFVVYRKYRAAQITLPSTDSN